ncbi:MAG: OmpA family protein, partial [Treponemataceae bacterium]|nr:OmpA family protein [Treponemataceae bacterium]
PTETEGFSHQTIFWDLEKGYIDHYNEEFQIVMKTSLGNIFVFNGVAHAEVTEFETTSDEKNLAAVIEKIQDLGIKDVSVTRGEKGLTIAIENIQFEPDSDILMATEKAKLNKIAKILNAYPNNDLLVTGHTALRGTAADRKKLSEQRAQSVADYLIKTKVRDKYHVFTKGMGGDAPIADNNTEEGRIKNRRVEITIMDK